MNIHKEGYPTLVLAFVFLLAISLSAYNFGGGTAFVITSILSLAIYIFLISFFRNPNRIIETKDNNLIYAPADGKVVVIEQKYEDETLKRDVIQISVFMSPLNVHVNRMPIAGTVEYNKYHKGKYLVAWHPKSSTENERTTVTINNGKHVILLRQIAGALARRIVNYAKVGQTYTQGQEYGFIKFGSRVDIMLPIGSEIKVNIDDVVKGNQTVLAVLPA